MADKNNGSKLHVVLIEWDGEKPPTIWYRRLAAMAHIKVREANAGSTNSLRVMLKDAKEDRKGIVVQEGAIICASYSLARSIRALAAEGFDTKLKDGTYGRLVPAAIYLAELEVDDSEIDERDVEVLGRMKAVYRKRGKKGPPEERAVTCLEEMKTHNHTGHAVANCPVCGGTQIRVRSGYAFRLADPADDAALSAWVRLRFGQSGQWELPEVADDGQVPAGYLESIAGMKNSMEQMFVAGLAVSPLAKQIDVVAGSNRHLAMELLDAAFIARHFWSNERRINARLAAVTRYFQNGNTDVSGISLAETPAPDLFDVAGPLGAERAAELMGKYMDAVKRQAQQPVPVPALPGMELVPA